MTKAKTKTISKCDGAFRDRYENVGELRTYLKTHLLVFSL